MGVKGWSGFFLNFLRPPSVKRIRTVEIQPNTLLFTDFRLDVNVWRSDSKLQLIQFDKEHAYILLIRYLWPGTRITHINVHLFTHDGED